MWNNYDPDKLTIGGATSATNAGTYVATFTPKGDYKWADGTKAAKSVNWTIGKAPGSFVLSKTALTLNIGSLSDTVDVIREGDGAVSAVSSDSAIATVSVSGTQITVTALRDGNTIGGSATITVKVMEGTNHIATEIAVIFVTTIFFSPVLADNTPKMIQEAARTGVAENYWNVGDRIPITLNGEVGALTFNDETYYAFIIGFNHNAEVEGNNTIHFQFGKNANGKDIVFEDIGSKAFYMNASNTNKDGWEGSYMRTTICPAFLAALPAEWRDIIAPCTKYSDNTGGGSGAASYVTATQDKIWILGEFEVLGKRSGANNAEQNYQKQYDYYKSGNSKIKYSYSNTNNVRGWWLRSVHAAETGYFRAVTTEGAVVASNAYSAGGFAPGFAVA